MRLLLLLVMVVGCHASEMDYPIGGGGGGGAGGVITIDAALGDGGGSGDIVATACVLTDARDLTSCSAVAGLAVSLGSARATTAADGTFTIARPTTAAQWDVTGSTVVESVTAYLGQTRIPVMSAAMLADLEAVNGVQAAPATGAVMVRVTAGGVPQSGETARLTPPNDPYGALYDPATAGAPWRPTATGMFGTVFLPGAATGTATLTLSAAGTTQGTLSGIPITDGGVTFVSGSLQ